MPPHFLKSLSLALLVAGCPLHNAVAESHCQLQPSAIIENAQEEEKQEKIQMPPHTVHVGAGYSYIISNIYAGGLDVDKLKHGAGYRYAEDNNIDIWTGKRLIEMTPEYSNAMELIDQNSFYVNHRNHGAVYQNRNHDLPNLQYLYKSYYREYVFPTPGVKGAGMQRFVIGRFREVYYTPDHYKSFYRLR